ncbi:acetyl-CoA carboxylase [Catenovulum maritimum]|uniref:Acetyl-CoA carboxylase n=2 Tax=Catenovulum maritimum TaxID=1513271 RepID=A0A0J8GN58_9ALTE|nr:acetyl-CoA carboxylase [Catenovulum maritimum]
MTGLAIGQVCAQPQISLFSLNQVEIKDGPFLHAQQVNINYLLELDADKLLAPYRREAGLDAISDSYGNWENTGLDGHIAGHYITALSLSYASSKDIRLLKRLQYMLAQLQLVQDANGDGYLGGIPSGEKMWNQVGTGKIDADLFSMNKTWVPWYNLHKMFAGLKDAYVIAGQHNAKEILLDYGDWVKYLVKNLSHGQIQKMLITEHGGMNEVFVDMAEISGDQEYLQLAKSFSQDAILNPLLKSEDRLNGLHANTQIPKIVGFKRYADATGNKEWNAAAEFFWQRVVNHRSTAIGGNSIKEHFHAIEDFESMVKDVEGPETCNTYNMLKLSKMLYLTSAETQYLDYYERALYNHILASQHPEHGGLVYFTSMRAGHYRKYSSVHDSMWCCVGSGIENHGKYGELIYAQDANDNLYVNLFIASKLEVINKKITLEQDTLFPEEETSVIRVKGEGQFSLNIRRPKWLADRKFNISVNGKFVKDSTKNKTYFSIKRKWHHGDLVKISLPMATKAEALPSQAKHYAIVHGPIVLAAKVNPFPNEKLNFIGDDSRMGHIASGQVCPPEALPVMLDNPDEFIRKLKPVAGQALTYIADEQVSNPLSEPVKLVPFYKLHDSRYQVYWPNATQAELAAFRQQEALKAAKLAAIEKLTIDKVAPGEQQPESDHFYQGENSEAGVHMGRHWRHTRAWFSYELNDEQQRAKILRISYFGLDNGRYFTILLNGNKIADVELKGDKGNQFFDLDYSIPSSVINSSNGKLTLKFIAKPGSVAGGIYGVRLMSAAK